MSIDWVGHPEWLEYAHSLWDERPQISAEKIAKRCAHAWNEHVTKNAIVGRAHNYGWDPRPSPIIRGGIKPDESCLPPGGNRLVVRSAKTLPRLESLSSDQPPVEKIECEAVRFVRLDGAPLYRRDGTGCLAVGCDGPLYSILKPYCKECAGKFYQNHKGKESYG